MDCSAVMTNLFALKISILLLRKFTAKLSTENPDIRAHDHRYTETYTDIKPIIVRAYISPDFFGNVDRSAALLHVVIGVVLLLFMHKRCLTSKFLLVTAIQS